jgi:hypothetical protein
MQRPISHILFTLLVWSLILASGQQIKAQAVWTGIGVRAKVHKLLSAEIEQQLRFTNEFSELGSANTEAGLRFRPWKHFGISGAYRYSNRPGSRRADDNDRQRWTGEAFYSIGSADTKWIFSHRLRYQTAKEISNEEEDPDRKNYIRNRLSLSYNLTKRVQPYLSYEWFYRLNGKNENQLTRFTMGLGSDIGKSFGIDTFFRVERQGPPRLTQMTLAAGLRSKKKKTRYFFLILVVSIRLDLPFLSRLPRRVPVCTIPLTVRFPTKLRPFTQPL